MWRDRILEAKKEKGIKTKAMADFIRMPEKTVSRILSGKTQAPYVDTVIALGQSVGLTPVEVFAETGLVVGDQDFAVLQAEVDRLNDELTTLLADAEKLKSQVSALMVENDHLQMRLEHKEELIKHKDEIIILLRSRLSL